MAERPFVEIDRVWMRYGGSGGTLALRDTTLSVDREEFVAVVGPSGCGKSTLMRLVTGLWPASSGSVLVAGREVDGPLSIAGMAFQNPTLLPWRSIMNNVMLPLEVVWPHSRRLRRERPMYEEQCYDLLDIGIGQVMPQVYQRISLGAQFGGIQQGLPPVAHCGGIKIRFKSLVFHKHLPVAGQRRIDLLQSFQSILKGLAEVQLSRKAGTIGQPDCEGIRAKLDAVPDHFDVVIDGLLPYFFAHML